MDNVQWFIKKTQFSDEIIRVDSSDVVSVVPEAPGNRHYEEYLAWVAEGNTPEIINEVE